MNYQTSTLIDCLHTVAHECGKQCFTIIQAADRLALLKSQLEQALPLVRMEAHNPFTSACVNIAYSKLATEIEESLK